MPSLDPHTMPQRRGVPCLSLFLEEITKGIRSEILAFTMPPPHLAYKIIPRSLITQSRGTGGKVEMFSSMGGTQINNTSVRSRMRYQLSHCGSPGGSHNPRSSPDLLPTGGIVCKEQPRHEKAIPVGLSSPLQLLVGNCKDLTYVCGVCQRRASGYQKRASGILWTTCPVATGQIKNLPFLLTGTKISLNYYWSRIL